MRIQRTRAYDTSFVPDRFAVAVAKHIAKNMLAEYLRTPLILGIHGRPGEGKTFQCECVLKQMGVRPFHIFAKDFESDRAGEPAALVCNTYQEASHAMGQRGAQMAVLVINDIDAGIGNWGHSVQYTVNTQLAISTLMGIADYPTLVGDRTTKRVPIIVTGNDFTRIYAPLVREGRMTTFQWAPTVVEKIEIVRRSIFNGSMLGDGDIERLVSAHADKPVAFFGNLQSSLIDEELVSCIRDNGLANCIKAVRARFKGEFSRTEYDIDTLLRLAASLSEDKVVNHLQ